MLSLSRIARFVLTYLAVTVAGQAQPAGKVFSKSVALSYEILGQTPSTVNPLAVVDYDPKTLKYALTSWTPPSIDDLKSTSSEPTSTPLLRVISPSGSTTIAGLSSFDTSLSQDINIWISQENGEVLSATIFSITPPPLSKDEELQRQKEERLRKRGKPVPSAKPKPKSKKQKEKEKDKEKKIGENVQAGPVVRVNLLVAGPGVKPQLTSRKPVQVDSEGREIVQEEQQEKTFFQKYWLAIIAVAFVLLTSVGGGDK